MLKHFTLVYQNTNACQAIPVFLLYHPATAKSNFTRSTQSRRHPSWWELLELFLPLYDECCQCKVCVWAFLGQACTEKHETARAFCNFIIRMGGKFNSSHKGCASCPMSCSLVAISCSHWYIARICWNGVLMTLVGEVHHTHLSCMVPGGFLSVASLAICIKLQLFASWIGKPYWNKQGSLHMSSVARKWIYK